MVFVNFARLLVLLLLMTQEPSVSAQEVATTEKTPCTLVVDMLGSARKCITESSDGKSSSSFNMDVPKDLMGFLTDSNKRACVVKCVMQDRGFVTPEGQINPDGFLANQAAIPEEMRAKLTLEVLQPCLDIAEKFDPNNCTTYSEFSSCILGVVVKAFDPAALDCFTKIPAIGPLFGLLQSTLASRAANNGTEAGFFQRMRERVSSDVGAARSKVSEWIKEIRN